MQPSIHLARLLPKEWPSPRYVRLPTVRALGEVSGLLRECFAEEREELAKLLRLLEDLRLLNGADAATGLVHLEKTSLMFLEFSLAIYGLKLKITRR